MAGYTKLFASILDSTVWATPQSVRCVWITMLAMSDRDGLVEASVPGLAKRAGVSREECEQALELFGNEDPDSRSREHDGRRIAQVDGGWRLLNYEKYRDRATFEERKSKDAARQKRKRERDAASRSVTPQSRSVTPSHAPSCDVRDVTHSDAVSVSVPDAVSDADDDDVREGASHAPTGSRAPRLATAPRKPTMGQSGASKPSSRASPPVAEDPSLAETSRFARPTPPPPPEAAPWTREPGKPPRPRPDLLRAKIPAHEYHPTGEHMAYAAELGIDSDEFGTVLIELRDKCAQPRGNLPAAGHDLPWWDQKLVAFIVARARAKADRPGHRWLDASAIHDEAKAEAANRAYVAARDARRRKADEAIDAANDPVTPERIATLIRGIG